MLPGLLVAHCAIRAASRYSYVRDRPGQFRKSGAGLGAKATLEMIASGLHPVDDELSVSQIIVREGGDGCGCGCAAARRTQQRSSPDKGMLHHDAQQQIITTTAACCKCRGLRLRTIVNTHTQTQTRDCDGLYGRKE